MTLSSAQQPPSIEPLPPKIRARMTLGRRLLIVCGVAMAGVVVVAIAAASVSSQQPASQEKPAISRTSETHSKPTFTSMSTVTIPDTNACIDRGSQSIGVLNNYTISAATRVDLYGDGVVVASTNLVFLGMVPYLGATLGGGGCIFLMQFDDVPLSTAFQIKVGDLAPISFTLDQVRQGVTLSPTLPSSTVVPATPTADAAAAASSIAAASSVAAAAATAASQAQAAADAAASSQAQAAAEHTNPADAPGDGADGWYTPNGNWVSPETARRAIALGISPGGTVPDYIRCGIGCGEGPTWGDVQSATECLNGHISCDGMSKADAEGILSRWTAQNH